MADSSKSSGLGGIFQELNNLVDRLGSLAEEGGEISRTTRFGDEDGDLSGVFGIHVRTGISREGRRETTVEPFGNVRADEDADDVVVEETREPVVDVYDEEEHLLVIAEMPGVAADDVTIALDGDVMTLAAETAARRYRKELLLPRAPTGDPTVRANNGIVDIRLDAP